MASKITELTAMTTAVTGDVIPIVDDPAGTPLTQKITAGNLATSIRTLNAATLTGADAAVSAAANVIGGIPVVHRIDIADAASGDTDVVLTHKTRVIDAWVIVRATGNAGNTYTVKNGSTAITDAITPGATDTTLKRAGTIDDAAHEIAAAGTLKISHVRAGSSSLATVYVLGIRVA